MYPLPQTLTCASEKTASDEYFGNNRYERPGTCRGYPKIGTEDEHQGWHVGRNADVAAINILDSWWQEHDFFGASSALRTIWEHVGFIQRGICREQSPQDGEEGTAARGDKSEYERKSFPPLHFVAVGLGTGDIAYVMVEKPPFISR